MVFPREEPLSEAFFLSTVSGQPSPHRMRHPVWLCFSALAACGFVGEEKQLLKGHVKWQLGEESEAS